MMRQHAILLGRHRNGSYITLPGSDPVAVHAPTRTGKTSRYVIPNCFLWPGSLVVLDVKGEAFKYTAGHRAAMGQEVYLFAPASLTGHTHRWNPFGSVNRASAERFAQISRAANLIFPEDNSANGNSKFWTDSGRMAFNAVMTLIAESGGDRMSLENLSRFFNRSDGHEMLGQKIARSRANGELYSQFVVDALSDYIGDDPKLRGDIRKTISTQLQIWSYPEVAAATMVSDFELSDLRRKPMTIYVAVSPNNIPMLRPLLKLFFDQLINENTDIVPEDDPSLRYQTLVMLDEFARLGRMDSLTQAAQFVGGYGLRMSYIMQNKAQVEAIYSAAAAADIFDNVGAEIIFATTDPKVTKELQERMGDNTVLYSTNNKPRFWSGLNWSKQHANEHIQARPLMLDQEIAQMPFGEQLIIRARMRPMRTLQVPWYDNPEFTTLYRPAPSIPRIKTTVALDDKTVPIPQPRTLSATIKR